MQYIELKFFNHSLAFLRHTRVMCLIVRWLCWMKKFWFCVRIVRDMGDMGVLGAPHPPRSHCVLAPQFYKTHPLLIVPIIPVTPIIFVILVTPVIPVSPATLAGKTRKTGNPNLLGIKKDTRVVGESWQNEKNLGYQKRYS